MSVQRRSGEKTGHTGALRQGVCPSCGRSAVFSFNGQQHWPAHIAAMMGIPAVVNLWNCEHCHSTISEPNLLDETG